MLDVQTPLVTDILEELAHVHGEAPRPCEEVPTEVEESKTSRVMIIDDAPINIKVVRKYLQGEGYDDIIGISDPREARDEILQARPDVVVLDIMMPEISGLEILQWIRSHQELNHIPVVILTASTDRETKLEALELGATDFLTKPVDRAELIPRIRNALTVKAHHDHLQTYAADLEEAVRRRTAELVTSRLEVVHCLARAAEFRDDITGRHVFRVGRYAAIIGAQLGMTEEQAHLLELAAQLHDVGKIGIPDDILNKPGKLAPDEFSLMQKHTGFGKKVFEQMDATQWDFFRDHASLGGKLLSTARSPLIQLASRIALTHHERWDGSGYPIGLKGDDIPLEGRITAVADVFDALSCARPYKPAYPLERCIEIMEEGRGSHFDPEVLDAFNRGRDRVIAVQIEYADVD